VFEDKLRMEAELAGACLGPLELRGFSRLTGLLLDWNTRMNLTAITDPGEIVTKHYVDSLSLCRFLGDASRVVDVGSGAGFPGLPLALARPDIEFCLIDSLQKRVRFLAAAIEELGLKNVSCAHIRAQEAALEPGMFERFDLAVSRAVAGMPLLAGICLPLVKPGGFFLAMKGPSPQAEAEDAKEAIKEAGGKLESIEPVSLSGGIRHTVVVVKKERSVASPCGKRGKRSKK
jgi:16S rRNA (guanine527-N7)-methyltransferase